MILTSGRTLRAATGSVAPREGHKLGCGAPSIGLEIGDGHFSIPLRELTADAKTRSDPSNGGRSRQIATAVAKMRGAGDRPGTRSGPD